MELYWLFFEAFFNIILTVFGVMLIIRAKDNHIRFWWGVCMTILGLVLLYGSAEWTYTYVVKNDIFTVRNYGLLRLTPMIEWFVVSVAISLFSVASLRPNYLTRHKIIDFFIPVLLVITIALCYYLFNGRITKLHTLKDIAENIHNLDVQVRLGIYGVIVVVLLTYFFAPIAGYWTSAWREAAPLMYVFVGYMFFMLFFYTAYVFFENIFIYRLICISNAIGGIIFSVYFLLYENPFSRHIVGDISRGISESHEKYELIDPVYIKIQEHFKTHHSFVDPNYTLKDIAAEMGIPQTRTIQAIKDGGFTGFHEYVNFLRVQHFKDLVERQPGLIVKELMHKCGFSSRSAFYRIFSELENTTPSKYQKDSTHK